MIAIGAALVALHLLLSAALYYVMLKPPEAFARVMSKTPFPAFLVLPFETLWTRARAGSLQVGDPAPDFSLPTLDKTARVQLSTLNSKQPVVLVFGSYT
jgi:thiamine pyrophosphate-dependent acetolactate synthase large subunit-like protein